MKLQYITLEIEDAKFTFKEVHKKKFEEHNKPNGEISPDLSALIMSHLRAVDNCLDEDDVPFTVQDFQNDDVPMSLSAKLNQMYWEEMRKRIGMTPAATV